MTCAGKQLGQSRDRRGGRLEPALLSNSIFQIFLRDWGSPSHEVLFLHSTGSGCRSPMTSEVSTSTTLPGHATKRKRLLLCERTPALTSRSRCQFVAPSRAAILFPPWTDLTNSMLGCFAKCWRQCLNSVSAEMTMPSVASGYAARIASVTSAVPRLQSRCSFEAAGARYPLVTAASKSAKYASSFVCCVDGFVTAGG